MKKTLSALLALVLLLGIVPAAAGDEIVLVAPETVEQYARLAEAEPQPGEPFLRISCTPDPIYPVHLSGRSDPVWLYAICAEETNGVPYTLKSIRTLYFMNDLEHDSMCYTPEQMEWESDTIPAYGSVTFRGGIPAIGDPVYKLVVEFAVCGSTGEELRFCCLADFTYDTSAKPVGPDEFLSSHAQSAAEGAPFVEVSFSPDPVTPLPPEKEDGFPMWMYTVRLKESAGIDCTVQKVTILYFDEENELDRMELSAEDCGFGDGTLCAGCEMAMNGGLPVQDLRYVGCEVTVLAQSGEEFTFAGMAELARE